MNSPAISHDDLQAAGTGNTHRSRSPHSVSVPGAEARSQDDLVRQLAERARTYRLKHQLQRIRRKPALPGNSPKDLRAA
jgi:hypothetical protein